MVGIGNVSCHACEGKSILGEARRVGRGPIVGLYSRTCNLVAWCLNIGIFEFADYRAGGRVGSLLEHAISVNIVIDAQPRLSEGIVGSPAGRIGDPAQQPW